MTITEISPATRTEPAPIAEASLGTSLPATSVHATPKLVSSRASTSPATMNASTPITPASPGPDFPPAKAQSASNETARAGTDEPGTSQDTSDDQRLSAGTGPIKRQESSFDQGRSDDLRRGVGAGPLLYDPALYLLAAQLDAIESLRIASANRHRMATRDVADSDGLMRGLGLTEDNPAVKRSAVMLDALEKTEHEVVLGLGRLMRAHPLGAWQKSVRGVGEKQLARLLACIGDPYWNTAKDEPRTVSQLWAYCGLHVLPAPGQAGDDVHVRGAGGGDVLPAGGDHGHKRVEAHTSGAGIAARRAKGQRANWSTDAKTKAYLIAESCLKAGSYRDIYDDHKARAAAAVHAADCAPCKAKAGTPLTFGHQHARAMRAMSKAILKDLWIEARRIHSEVSA